MSTIRVNHSVTTRAAVSISPYGRMTALEAMVADELSSHVFSEIFNGNSG